MGEWSSGRFLILIDLSGFNYFVFVWDHIICTNRYNYASLMFKCIFLFLFTDMLYIIHLLLVVLVLMEDASFADTALQIGKKTTTHTYKKYVIERSYFKKCVFIFNK